MEEQFSTTKVDTTLFDLDWLLDDIDNDYDYHLLNKSKVIWKFNARFAEYGVDPIHLSFVGLEADVVVEADGQNKEFFLQIQDGEGEPVIEERSIKIPKSWFKTIDLEWENLKNTIFPSHVTVDFKDKSIYVEF